VPSAAGESFHFQIQSRIRQSDSGIPRAMRWAKCQSRLPFLQWSRQTPRRATAPCQDPTRPMIAGWYHCHDGCGDRQHHGRSSGVADPMLTKVPPGKNPATMRFGQVPSVLIRLIGHKPVQISALHHECDQDLPRGTERPGDPRKGPPLPEWN